MCLRTARIPCKICSACSADTQRLVERIAKTARWEWHGYCPDEWRGNERHITSDRLRGVDVRDCGGRNLFADAWLGARARLATLTAAGTGAGAVSVEAYHGNVVLAGFVATSTTRDAILRAVRQCVGRRRGRRPAARTRPAVLVARRAATPKRDFK
jgi:hypothetical protein